MSKYATSVAAAAAIEASTKNVLMAAHQVHGVGPTMKMRSESLGR
jgi:hypothetical protein